MADSLFPDIPGGKQPPRRGPRIGRDLDAAIELTRRQRQAADSAWFDHNRTGEPLGVYIRFWSDYYVVDTAKVSAIIQSRSKNSKRSKILRGEHGPIND